MTSDPLDDQIRRTVEKIPIPEGLEDRIRRSATLRRRARWAVAGLAAAALLLLWPRPHPVEPSGTGPIFSLRDPAPESLEMKPIAFTAEIRSGSEGLSFRFVKGGPHDE